MNADDKMRFAAGETDALPPAPPTTDAEPHDNDTADDSGPETGPADEPTAPAQG